MLEGNFVEYAMASALQLGNTSIILCSVHLAHQEKCVQVFARQDMPESAVALPNRALTRYDNVDSAALYADPIWSHRYTMKFHCPPTTKYM